MSVEKEYYQCSHTRKCKWVGEYSDLRSVRNKKHPDIEMYDMGCPYCGNLEHYIINEEEYQKKLANIRE